MSAFQQSMLIIILFVVLLISITPALASDNSVGELAIPALNIDAEVVSVPLGSPTWDVSSLRMNVGHLEGTAWVDMPGNIVLAGHSLSPSMEPEIFVDLDKLSVGSEIFLTVNGEQRRYIVSEVRRVHYRDVSPVQPTNGERLTLFTCAEGTYDASINNYLERDVVIAERAF